MAFQAHSQDEAHVWWPSFFLCLEVLGIWFAPRLKYIQKYQQLNSTFILAGEIVFVQGRGKRSLTPWAAMKTATLPNCRLRPSTMRGKTCKERWSTSPEMGLTNHIICTCMSEVAIDASYNQLQRAKTSRSIIYRILHYCAHWSRTKSAVWIRT